LLKTESASFKDNRSEKGRNKKILIVWEKQKYEELEYMDLVGVIKMEGGKRERKRMY